MKKIYILAAALLATLASFAQRSTSYARYNQNVTIDLDWKAGNYGSIAWETSTDGGKTWTAVKDNESPVYTFKAVYPTVVRATVKGDPACPPVVEEREIKLLNFGTDLISAGSDFAELEISKNDLKDAGVVEYGFTALLSGVGRTYSINERIPVGTAVPDADTFTIMCKGLRPGQSYSVRPYFKTADGSVVFGVGKLVNTLEGLEWDTEDWIIEKTSLQIPFSIAGYSSGAANAEIWLGKDEASLVKYDVESKGNGHFRSKLIEGLTPGTDYLVVAKAKVDGDAVEIRKTVRTWGDYSSFKADDTVIPVSHIVEWDKKAMQILTPETKQVEYPRMCRIDDNKILFTYHGGNSDHWQNSYIRKSYDNGLTWTEPVELYNTLGSFFGTGFWRICNPEMTRLQNGWVILTVVANANPEGNANSKVLACLSKDGGETWGNPLIVGRGRTWEPQVIQMPNGELELLVSSEAYWWDNEPGAMKQEILSTRSTDNGETWTTYKRASFKPGARDGMPVSVVMQGNKGVMFIEESVNGGIPPSLQWRPLDGEWDTADWDGKQDERRWLSGLNNGAGAPYMIQLPTGEFLIMAHSNATGKVWQTSRPQVVMADNTGHNFKYARLPLSATALPSECGAYYGSFFLYDKDTVWMLVTKAQYNGTTRVESDVLLLPGKIVEKLK